MNPHYTTINTVLPTIYGKHIVQVRCFRLQKGRLEPREVGGKPQQAPKEGAICDRSSGS